MDRNSVYCCFTGAACRVFRTKFVRVRPSRGVFDELFSIRVGNSLFFAGVFVSGERTSSGSVKKAACGFLGFIRDNADTIHSRCLAVVGSSV